MKIARPRSARCTGQRSLRSDTEHPYRQLAARLREQIQCGKITTQMPSITTLTAETGLAVGTVRRAIDLLVRQHLVQTVPGRGTFVTNS
jgi:DNA-binding GntR family transcriptional regulator